MDEDDINKEGKVASRAGKRVLRSSLDVEEKPERDPEAHYIAGSQLHHAIAMPFHVRSRIVCPVRPYSTNVKYQATP